MQKLEIAGWFLNEIALEMNVSLSEARNWRDGQKRAPKKLSKLLEKLPPR